RDSLDFMWYLWCGYDSPMSGRIVKNVMKTGNVEGKIEQDFYGRIESPYKLVNNKVIIPSEEEQRLNPRSRSAKLRIAERK
ncbi:MAG: 16S rRNA (cytosine(1402)-N(4))-methyltransferase, partial [Prevotella sp.]